MSECKAPEVWYEVNIWGDISAIQVERSTKSSVWVIGDPSSPEEQRRARTSEYSGFFPTVTEAKDWLRGRVQSEIAIANRRLQALDERLEKIERIAEPQ